MEINTRTQFAPLYSSESAVGLILATGNTGPTLSNQESSKGLYVSRDGGAKWKHVKQGNWIYETGDHGALIVTARKDDPTTDVQFSLDEGHTWNKFKVSEKRILVQSIVIEPRQASQQFILHGLEWRD